jgi:CRP-like cAMP-binding protein
MTRITPHCLTCKVHNCTIMKSCEPELLQTITTYKHTVEYKKGEKLFNEGDEIQGMHFIQSGIVKLEMHGKRNRNFILRLAGQGYALGHRNLNGNKKQPFSAVAVEDTRACFIDGDHFRSLMAPAKALQQELLKSCQQETSNTEQRLLQMAHLSVREKVAVVLLHLADIYQYKPDGMGIRVHLDRQEMADLAGTTKEQVSKVLADLTLEKIIRFRAKHFKHMDIPTLKHIADGVNEPVLAMYN